MCCAPRHAWAQHTKDAQGAHNAHNAYSTTSHTPYPADPDARLALAKKAYQTGELDRLRPLLLPILEPTPQLDTVESRVEARTLLAVGVYIEAQSVKSDKARAELLGIASTQFLNILREQPEFDLDARLYPASIVELFAQVREDHKDELDTLRKKNNQDKQDNQDNQDMSSGKLKTIYIERVVQRRNYALNFAPFGLGHFQNKDTWLGIAAASSQALALGINMGSYTWLMLHGSPSNSGTFNTRTYPLDGTYETSLFVKNAQWYSAIAFVLLYAASTGASVWRFEPLEVERLETLERPPPELTPQSLIHIGPSSVQWTFKF